MSHLSVLLSKSDHALAALDKIPLARALKATREIISETSMNQKSNKDTTESFFSLEEFFPHLSAGTSVLFATAAFVLSLYNFCKASRLLELPPQYQGALAPIPPKSGYTGIFK
jgi:hypothetical protein